MNQSLVLALFAFLVVVISFLRLLGAGEFFRLTALKRAWGRVRGLCIFFLANVAFPLVVGIVFLAQGVTTVHPGAADRSPGESGLMQFADLARVSAQEALGGREGKNLGPEYWHWGEFSQL